MSSPHAVTVSAPDSQAGLRTAQQVSSPATTREFCSACETFYDRLGPFSHRCPPSAPTVISRRVSADEWIDGRREGELHSVFDHD